MLHHVRHVAQAVVRLAEAVVVTVFQDEADRLRVAVGHEEVTVIVDDAAKRVDHAARVVLDPRSVEPEAKRVSRVHRDRRAIAACHMRRIVEPVTGVEPAVVAASEGVAHAVRVLRKIKRPVEFLSLVGLSVAIGVTQEPDVRNAEADDSILVRVETHRDVELVGKRGHLVGSPVAVRVFENPNRVLRLAIIRSRNRVLLRT